MVRPVSKKNVGLGRALQNDTAKNARRGGNPSSRHTTEGDSYGSNANLRSVTQQRALDEFLSTAELANTDFTAEKSNVKIIATSNVNMYLLTPEQQDIARAKHDELRQSLTVPRRPAWTMETTPTELDRQEKEAFLAWRRHLAQLQEENDLLLTPFERNLEVWRQLWRVLERSDLIVQIVDARDPLLFRSTDLEKYVHEVDPVKRNLLLVNKADLLTYRQRIAWAAYFRKHNIRFSFFSAAMAKAEIEATASQPEAGMKAVAESPDNDVAMETSHDGNSGVDNGTEILSVNELEQLFLNELSQFSENDVNVSAIKVAIGLVGYPNVGKSSTINALVGAKTVSVSSTPGKTKHFQTIQLSEQMTLVDCPGLVFPNFASTPADLVCAGVLPIDQLREFTGPTALVAQRIPKSFLDHVYGLQIQIKSAEEGGSGTPTAEELLTAYALSRGFTKSGQGNPDESRAARYILKDYVAGKLLYIQPPPGTMSGAEFNAELYVLDDNTRRKKAPSSHVSANASTFVANGHGTPTSMSTQVNAAFFQASKVVSAQVKGTTNLAARGSQGSVNGKVIMYPFQQRLNDDASVKPEPGKFLTGRKARLQAALDQGVPVDELQSSKKHYKGKQRQKSRPIMN